MPAFDLRGIKVAQYVNTSGTITYTGKASIGDAMGVNIELRYAEGRLYAESVLAEYMKAVTGGTISIAVKYIPDSVQSMLFGSTAKSRSVGTETTTTISGLQTKASDTPKAVGVAFYAPAMIDGVEKYTCVFISRALFGQPSKNFATKGDSITFQTPTTTGEFMADHSTNRALIEVATADTEANAKDWVDTVLT